MQKLEKLKQDRYLKSKVVNYKLLRHSILYLEDQFSKFLGGSKVDFFILLTFPKRVPGIPWNLVANPSPFSGFVALRPKAKNCLYICDMLGNGLHLGKSFFKNEQKNDPGFAFLWGNIFPKVLYLGRYIEGIPYVHARCSSYAFRKFVVLEKSWRFLTARLLRVFISISYLTTLKSVQIDDPAKIYCALT